MLNSGPDPGWLAVQSLVDEYAAVLAAAQVAFGHGTDNAADEALRLVTSALHGRRLTPAIRAELDALLKRRVRERLPVPYLTGEIQYHDARLRVPAGVMIPRSPIAEILAGGVWPWLAAPPGRILDLCCGSGALGIVAGTLFPGAVVDLVDDDPAALDAARENVRRAERGIARRLEVVASNLFEHLGGRRYDLVLCNPPYVPTAELDAAPAEFHHEPRHGLDGGTDGLAVWRRIVASLDDHLTATGVLIGEVGNLSREFDAAFPELGAVWLDLRRAEVQAGGGFGVFAVVPALRREPARADSPPA